MGFIIRPATAERFDDLCTILGPKKPGARGCWCLATRFGHKTDEQLVGPARAEFVRDLCGHNPSPGVLAYDGDEVVGWAAAAPLAEVDEYSRGKRYGTLERPEGVWALWCLRVRAGHARQGIATALVGGAAEHAQRSGASAAVGYPVDNQGQPVDRTLASVGVIGMFERHGFRRVGTVAGSRDHLSQVVMRKDF